MVPLGACDVAVCDGYSGNVMLKTIEGVAKFMAGEIKTVFMRNLATKLGYLACKKGMDDFRELFNQDKVGGAPFLGIAKPVIKAHGSSNEIAVKMCIRDSYATALHADSMPLDTVPLERAAVIIGSEGRGVSQSALNLSDKRVIIPMAGRAESLNAGVAAAIVIYEMTK